MKFNARSIIKAPIKFYHESDKYPLAGNYSNASDRWFIRSKAIMHVGIKNWDKIALAGILLMLANNNAFGDVPKEFFKEVGASSLGLATDKSGLAVAGTTAATLSFISAARKYDRLDPEVKPETLKQMNILFGTGLAKDLTIMPLSYLIPNTVKNKFDDFFKAAPKLKLVDNHPEFSPHRQVVNYLSALSTENKNKLVDALNHFFEQLEATIKSTGNALLIRFFESARSDLRDLKEAIHTGGEVLSGFLKSIGGAIEKSMSVIKGFIPEISQEAIREINEKHKAKEDGYIEHSPLEAILFDTPEASNESPGVSPAPLPKDDTVVDIAGRVKAFRDRHNIQPPKGMAM